MFAPHGRLDLMPRTAAKPSAKTSARRTGTPARAVKSKIGEFQAMTSQAPNPERRNPSVEIANLGSAKAAGVAVGIALGRCRNGISPISMPASTIRRSKRDLDRAPRPTASPSRSDYKGKLAAIARGADAAPALAEAVRAL